MLQDRASQRLITLLAQPLNSLDAIQNLIQQEALPVSLQLEKLENTLSGYFNVTAICFWEMAC